MSKKPDIILTNPTANKSAKDLGVFLPHIWDEIHYLMSMAAGLKSMEAGDIHWGRMVDRAAVLIPYSESVRFAFPEMAVLLEEAGQQSWDANVLQVFREFIVTLEALQDASGQKKSKDEFIELYDQVLVYGRRLVKYRELISRVYPTAIGIFALIKEIDGTFQKSANLTHGSIHMETYQPWVTLKAYHIKKKNREVCAEWSSFETFLADMGQMPIGGFLCRKDETKPFNKENCEWRAKKGKISKVI